jgi:hypothetical protein
MHTTRSLHRLTALGASLLALAAIPAVAEAGSHPAMKHHPAMKKHHPEMKHHPAMKR